jgi:hypothetical protein
MASDRKYINGLYFKKKHKNAPDFVIGKGAIDPERLRMFLDENPLAEGEKYINFQILEVKGSPEKGTFIVDDWKPNKEVNTDEQQQKYEAKKAKEAEEQKELDDLRNSLDDGSDPSQIPF